MKRTTRFYLLALAFVVGCGPEDDLQYLIESQLGPAGGIDQSENPGKGTVYDACNVQTWDGTWKSVGMVNAHALSTAPMSYAEYIADKRYADSHYNALLLLGEETREDLGGSHLHPTLPTGHDPEHNIYTAAPKLFKKTVNGEVKYIPSLILCDGVNIPAVYHQLGGAGQFDSLSSISGGLTGTTYLAEPPIGRYCLVYKERLFVFNCKDAGNRVYFSGVNDAGVFAANIWPGSYNMDLGNSEPITGAIVWKDRIVVFKQNSIGVMSGDGVGGAWNYEEVDGAHGTISHFSIVDAGDSLYFLGEDGIYQWAGGLAKNITADKLKDTWKEFGDLRPDYIYAGIKMDTARYGFYEKSKNRLIFQIMSNDGVRTHIVINLNTGSIDRWGQFSRSNTTAVPTVYFYGALNSVLLGSALHVGSEGLFSFEENDTASRPWFIQTQKLLNDQYTKTYRELRLDAKKTGTWSLTVLPLVDDDGPAEALRRYAGSKWNMAIDITNAAEHLVNGQSQFHAVTDGPVDIFSIKTLGKAFDSLVVAAHTGETKIKFSAAKDFSTYDVGTLLIIPEDLARIYRQSMAPGTETVGNGWELDEDILVDPDYEKIMIPINATGTSLSLYFTNLESAGTATAGVISDIKGWTVWAMPSRGMRR